MRLSPGERVNHFEILSVIGKGGMGEVYKARDTRLNRVVAIKVSEAEFSERFEREARAIAALNHPNICTLHDIGPNYLVMEYVEGRSPKGPLSLDQGLRIASQVAAALEAAHERGLVHRDLKPGNILVKPDGTVKVLDFGLAKMTQAPSIDPNDPTAQAPLTEAGVVMGTPAYMAPEQAEGKPVDKRADIWAFGVILFELLSGERLFKGDTAQNTLAQVLSKDPDLSKVPKETRLLLRRCLERDSAQRLRDIGDAMPLVAQTIHAEAGNEHPGSPDHRAWVVAAVFALVALAVSVVHFREAPMARPAAVRFKIPYPVGLKPSDSAIFSLSPDGSNIAYLTSGAEGMSVWVHALDSLEPRLLLGPEARVGDAIGFWSSDSRSLVVYSEGRLKKASLSGGGAQAVCDSPGLLLGGSTHRDQILFGALGSSGILRVPWSGGTSAPVTKLDDSRKERAHLMPFFLPDGRHFLYLKVSTEAENTGIYIGSLDTPPDEQSIHRLIATGSGAEFVPGVEGTGSILFLREGLLMAQDFDPASLQVRGEPKMLTSGVGNTRAFPFFASSASGNLIYRTTPIESRQMTWLDRKGREIGKVGDPLPLSDTLRLNPSGTQVAVSQWDATDRTKDLWLYTFSPYRSLRLTRGPSTNSSPTWSADGARVAYASGGSALLDLNAVNANGDGQQTLLLQSKDDKYPSSWSKDGYLLYSLRAAGLPHDLWVLPPVGRSFPFLTSSAEESAGSFSPDGHWVAYLSDESGTPELYIRSFKPPINQGDAVAGPRIPVSTGGASPPHWRADGRELFYLAPNGLMAVPVTLGETAQIGRAIPLFPAPTPRYWDVAPDGQSFLFAIPSGPQIIAPFTVVLNWRADKRESAPERP